MGSEVDLQALKLLDTWEWWRHRQYIIDALERAALYRSALLYIKTGNQTAKKMREVATEALADA